MKLGCVDTDANRFVFYLRSAQKENESIYAIFLCFTREEKKTDNYYQTVRSHVTS